MSLADIVARGWDAVLSGDLDTLLADYVDDLRFIMPGQDDVLEGKEPLRTALQGLGGLLPPGFDVTGLRHIEGDGEVVTIMEWACDKVDASQLIVLFKFTGDKVHEERWFIDTEQWKGAF
jgi:ketosteroid isomerase-like protein